MPNQLTSSVSQSWAALFVLVLTSLVAACSDGTLEPLDGSDIPVVGNVTEEDFADLTSAAYIMIDGEYHFFAVPGKGESAITALDADAGLAWGWSRTIPESNDEGFRLDLRTNTFETIRLPGVDRTIPRGVNAHGQLVGLANVRVTSDSYGFILDQDDGSVTEVRRPGYTQGAVTDISDDGVLVGYSNFGGEGWVFRDGAFEPLEHAEAGRLFPLEVSTDGEVVGLWGEPGAWWDPSRGFRARPSGSGWAVDPYRVSPDIRSSLNGINDAGQMAGLYWPNGLEGKPAVFTLDAWGGTPGTHPLPSVTLQPWVDGMDELGRVFGHVIIDHAPADASECGGHGHLHGTECHCDPGYQQDPDDPGMCIPS
jgi:hypothetical protein